MTKDQQNLGLWEGSYEFYTGKLHFEEGLHEKVRAYFEIAIEIGKGYRFFEKKDFYINPKQNIK